MDSLYDYQLPESHIAQAPATPRDSAKLFIYETQTGKIQIDRYSNLAHYLPKDSLLIFNQSKVLPCRVAAQTQKNEPIELLVMTNEWKPSDKTLKATVNKKLHPGEQIELAQGYKLSVVESHEKIFQFTADFSLKELPTVLAQIGEMPLPRYIQNCPLTEKEKRRKYQTIFAKEPGSVAAPTASLHFTPRLIKKLEKTGIHHEFLTLHVGLGTFAPVLPEHLETRSLYKEYYEIPKEVADRIQSHKQASKPVFAVGTTATRALESWAQDEFREDEANGNKITSIPRRETRLFILPPYPFKVIDGLLTNFHVPGSSLMMLVEAFLQNKKAPHHLKELYKIALKQDFRFYSFGDGMLIL